MQNKAKVISTAAAICALAYSSAIPWIADESNDERHVATPVLENIASSLETANDRDVVRASTMREPAAGSLDYSAGDFVVNRQDEVLGQTEIPRQAYGPPAGTAENLTATSESAPVSPRDKMSGPVAALAAAGGQGPVEIVVRYDQHPGLFDDDMLESLGGVVTREFRTLDMRAIRIPAASLESLASDDAVEWLSVDDEISFTSASSRIAANVPSGTSANVVYGGSGVGIAILDTGIAPHADLDATIVQYSFLKGAYPEPTIDNSVITALHDDTRNDGFGHGTHVAGIVTGDGTDSDGDFKGMSTNATLLSLQVLDKNGHGSMSDVMAALDWLSVYGSYFDIRVVNLSLGKGISESNTTDPLVLAVEQLWDAGMVVVVAAGNEGNSGSMTVNSPANSRKVITVGSWTDSGTGTDFTDDYVSSFSSRGPTIGDLVLKPDLVAPGNRIVASVDPAAKLAVMLPGRINSCKATGCASVYIEMSGTSMATPAVSAAVALMLDKDPTLTPATVKARLMRSARKLDALPIDVGAGLLDVEAAMNDTGTIAGEALSPLMVRDAASDGVLVEDTALLWGSDLWDANYLFTDSLVWANGYGWTDDNGVTANGYMWTDSGVWANGYGWTDAGITANAYGWTDEDIGAKAYGWTDEVRAKTLLSEDGTVLELNDDPPAN